MPFLKVFSQSALTMNIYTLCTAFSLLSLRVYPFELLQHLLYIPKLSHLPQLLHLSYIPKLSHLPQLQPSPGAHFTCLRSLCLFALTLLFALT